jgi:hypothetical protein
MPPRTYGSAHKPTAAGFYWFTSWTSGISGRKSSSIRLTCSNPALFLFCNGAAREVTFYLKRRKTHEGTSKRFKPFEEMNISPVCVSLSGFKDSEDLEDHLRNGRPSTAWNQVAVAKVRELVVRISRLTPKLTEDQLHIKLETSHQILNPLAPEFSFKF